MMLKRIFSAISLTLALLIMLPWTIIVFADETKTEDSSLPILVPDILIKTGDKEFSNITLENPYIVYSETFYIPWTQETKNYLGCTDMDFKYNRYSGIWLIKKWEDYEISAVNFAFSQTPWNPYKIYNAEVSYNEENYYISTSQDFTTISSENKTAIKFNQTLYIPLDKEIFDNLNVSFEFENGVLTLFSGKVSPGITIPDFPIILNGIEYDNKNAKYPFVMFNDIVYMPLEENIRKFMGIGMYRFDYNPKVMRGYNQLCIGNTFRDSESLDAPTKENDQDFLSTLNMMYGMNFYVNTENVGGEALKMKYPPLRFENMYYVPMTYQISVENLEWKLDFDSESGFMLDSRDTFRPAYYLPRVITYPSVYLSYGYYLEGDYYVSTERHIGTNYTSTLYFTRRDRKTTKLDCSIIYEIAGSGGNSASIGDFDMDGNICTFEYNGCKFTVDMDTAEILNAEKSGAVRCTIPEFAFTINGTKIDYNALENSPVYYNGIVYLPLTEEFGELCGLGYTEDTRYKEIRLRSTNRSAYNKAFDNTSVKKYSTYFFLDKTDVSLYVTSENGSEIAIISPDPTVLKYYASYYLPLSEEIVSALGWKLTFDGNTSELNLETSAIEYVYSGDTYAGFYPNAKDYFPEIVTGKKNEEPKVIDISDICKEYGTYDFTEYSEKHPIYIRDNTLIIYTYSEVFEFMGFLEINLLTGEAVFRMDE